MKNLIRFGIISSVDPEKCTARVTFPDRDNLVSAELPILQAVGLKNKSYLLPDVNESVVCLMMPNDPLSRGGFILGSFFNDKSKPPAANQDISRIKFGDGTTISYDRAAHELRINCNGRIRINGSEMQINCAEMISITAPEVFILNLSENTPASKR